MAGRVNVILLLGLALVARATADSPAAKAAKKLNEEALVSGARTVLAAIVQTAERNQRLALREEGGRGPFRRTGDELTEAYVRSAATVARQLPAEQRGPAFLVALGIALDDSSLIRDSLLTRSLWRKIEPDPDRARRLRVLGSPTIQGRHDLAQHFSVSAALTALQGKKSAEMAGLVKELLDARPGGSGFSFADLAADFAGIAFAEQVLADPERLSSLERSFHVADYTLPPRGLPEGLSQAEFSRRYGSTSDRRFEKEVAGLRQRLQALPGVQRAKKR
jgi:hypothetical protein